MEPAVLNFVEAARGFRGSLADGSPVERREYARLVRNAIARVYLAAAYLPSPGAVTSEEISSSVYDHAASATLRESIAARFADYDVFVDVWDPTGLTDEDRPPIERSLSQELVEIDDELANALRWLTDPESPADVLWDVAWAFENHWGTHAVAVLRPLHQIAVRGVG